VAVFKHGVFVARPVEEVFATVAHVKTIRAGRKACYEMREADGRKPVYFE
jgi:hypothetical protein